MLAGFDDPSVVGFFNKQQAAPLGARETLLVEAYQQVHGGTLNLQRIHSAVETLAREHGNRQFLVEVAHELRDAAFVPYLISIADYQPDKHSRQSLWNAQDALEKITFTVRIEGKNQWERWFATYGRAGREKWLQRALDSLRQLIRENEPAAVTFFDAAVYRWDDIALLSFVDRELVARPAFRHDVAGWISLTYRPVYRSRLEPLARRIAAHSASLAPWTRALLVERGFLPGGRKSTWSEYVRESNMRI